MGPNEKGILKTLIYSDIFSYPLAKKELWKYYIGPAPLTSKTFLSALRNVSADLSYKDGFFCIKGREDIFKLRKKRARIGKEKIQIAKNIAMYLSYIPTVLFVGISGGLARSNAEEVDDIDFFIISRKHTLWLTRFMVLICLTILGRRRSRDTTLEKNLICVNMLVGEDALAFDHSRHELYTAVEVAQLKTLINKEKTYERFISENLWVQDFLPHAFRRSDQELSSSRKTSIISLVLYYLGIEYVFRMVQLIYMRSHKTQETTLESRIAFHPIDYRQKTLKEYNNRLKKYDTS